MSVIQDALKRKLAEQREARKSAAASRGARGTAPPPQAPSVAQQVLQNEDDLRPPSAPAVVRRPHRVSEGSATAERQRTLRLLIASVMALLAIALVGAIIYFLQVRDEEFASITPHALSVPAGQERAPASGSPSPVGAGVATSASSATPTTPAPGATASSVPAGQQADVVTLAADEAWPLIEVSGIIAGRDPSRSTAVLNGEMVRLNRKIQGVLLVNLNDDGATLEFNGSQMFVEIGDTTHD